MHTGTVNQQDAYTNKTYQPCLPQGEHYQDRKRTQHFISNQAPRLCSTQLSRKFQLLRKTKILSNEEVSCLSISDVVHLSS